MRDFSIELSAEQIVDSRSKEYFSEVLSSFINNHYRSAAVMLWSVVIADLVYKLQALRDLYQDATAIAILNSIQSKQLASPKNPEWEPYLLDEINNRTQFFEAGEYIHMQNLQSLRHLSAHPILSSTNLLFHPNKETTRAAIRNALECVLLKPPVFSKKVVDLMIKDLAASKGVLPDKNALQMYLEAKYFKNLHPAVKVELIKTLWKLCFRISNTDVEANRDINYRTLLIIFNRDPMGFVSLVTQNSEQFSVVATEGMPLITLIAFLSKCKNVYQSLTNAAKVPIAELARTNVNYFAHAHFINNSLSQHIIELTALPIAQLAEISDECWQILLSKCKEENLEQEVFSIAIKIYTNSTGFNSADSSFARFIAPYINDFNKERLVELVAGIEKNDQTYYRNKAKADHKSIKSRIDLIGNINLDTYVNFQQYLS